MIELYAHQEAALTELKDGKILNGGVGSGKSIISLEYYVRNHSPKPLYVITTAKKRDSSDWQAACGLFSITGLQGATMHGSVVVDSWNNLGRYSDVKNAFFIFDEQRIVGNGAWVKSFLKIAKSNAWILLSATPGDTWLDYIPVFLANGFYKNRTEFIREHVVYASWSKFPRVERYLGVRKLEKLRKELLVDVPYYNPRTRIEREVIVGYDLDGWDRVWKKKWHIYKNRPIKNRAELGIVARKLVNSSEDRLAVARLEAGKAQKLIIFYNLNCELEQLRRLSDEFIVAEWNGKKHEPLPEGNSWVYLVQVQAGAEGWECITTNNVLFYSLPYSYRMFEQCKGRIDRLNSPYLELNYTILRSKSPLDWSILKTLKAKKDFNFGAVFKDKIGV